MICYHSGDVSDEARRDFSSHADRVAEVGSRDSGKPRAGALGTKISSGLALKARDKT
jgi:hypothetical protein